MDKNKLILRNTEDLWQEGATQQDNHNGIFDFTLCLLEDCAFSIVPLSQLPFQLLHSSMDLTFNLWLPEGFVQVRSLTVLGVANFVGNTDVEWAAFAAN